MSIYDNKSNFRDIVLKPHMTRCLVILPFNIRCHKCSKDDSEDELVPVSIKLDGKNLIIHPPIKIGANAMANLPAAKWKNLGLNFNHEGYNPEEHLPRPEANSAEDDSEFCNGLIIDFPNIVDSQSIEAFFNGLIERLCYEIRIVTKQYWIMPNIFIDQIVGLRYMVVLDGGLKHIRIGTSNLLVYPEYLPYEILTQSIFISIVRNLKSYFFSFEEHKFLDGIRNFAVGQVMNSILDVSLAAEIAKNRMLDRIWLVELPREKVIDSNYKKIGFYGNNLKEHVSKLLKKSRVNKSFKEEFPDEYLLISKLWKFRCQAGHGDDTFKNDNGKPIELKKTEFTKIAIAVMKLRNFCDSIKVPK